MKPEMYWVATTTAGRLAVMPRPRGGDWLEDEVRGWRSAGVDILVSLLMSGETIELGLAQEQALCEAHGIEFISFPIEDRSVPVAREAATKLCRELAQKLNHGKNVAVHCRQGLGRAPLLAIGVLIMAGLDADAATSAVSAARGVPVPETCEQAQWIARFGKEAPALICN